MAGDLSIIYNAKKENVDNAPGDSVSVDLSTYGESSDVGELYHSPGQFSKPIDGTRGVSLDVNGQQIVVATNEYRLSFDLDKGETLLYSLDGDSNIMAKIYLDKSGNIEINAADEKAVMFAPLKSGFDQLVSDLNAELDKIATGIASAGGSYTPAKTTASVDDSESEKISLS